MPQSGLRRVRVMASAIACFIAVCQACSGGGAILFTVDRDRIATALKSYEDLAARGGWKRAAQGGPHAGSGRDG